MPSLNPAHSCTSATWEYLVFYTVVPTIDETRQIDGHTSLCTKSSETSMRSAAPSSASERGILAPRSAHIAHSATATQSPEHPDSVEPTPGDRSASAGALADEAEWSSWRALGQRHEPLMSND
jgi:hypothetical protein